MIPLGDVVLSIGAAVPVHNNKEVSKSAVAPGVRSSWAALLITVLVADVIWQ